MDTKTVLTEEQKKVVKKYREHLISSGIPVEKIILFGSYAKGESKPWSDIDICVVSSKFGKDNYRETVWLKKLAVDIDPVIEAHPYSSEGLKNKFDPLAFEILKTGKVVV